MLQWGGEEVKKDEGGGAVGEFGEVLIGLWGTAGDSQFVEVPVTGYDCGG